MKYPKMILFDYGHTLLYEPGWDSVRGNAELMKYVTKNPNHYTDTDRQLIGAIAIGYPNECPHQRPRKTLDEIVEFRY